MYKLSPALVGKTTNATIEVCKKSAINFALLAITFLTFVGISKAATFSVTNVNDSGAGSLRQAIIDANNAAGADSITFSQNPFGSNQQIITVLSELPISTDIIIDGTNAKTVWINGGLVGRVFNITGGNVVINNLTITGGRAPNTQSGGGIIISGSGTTTLMGVTIWNCAATDGGAISMQGSGNLIVQNSTIFLNNSTNQGGGIVINNAASTTTITSSTLAYNGGGQFGGGVRVLNGSLVSRNSIYANNSATTHPDVSGNVTSQGYNLFKNATGASITGTTTGNQLNVDPLINAFGDFGGGTQTFMLPTNSPAIDAGDPALANTTDQRRARRNTDGNYNSVVGVDIGAFEKQRTAFDYDGEGSADLTVLRSSGTGLPLFWYNGYQQVSSRPEEFVTNSLLNGTPNAVTGFQFGLESDIATPGDYDGDGKMDAAVFRPTQGIWYVNRTTGGFLAFPWGLSGDIPVPADYDGDGKTDFAVVRGNIWYVYKSTQGYTGAVVLGTTTDKPVPADYDGDLKADTAVYSNGTWIINRSTGGQTVVSFGLATDVAVPADFDGDGLDNVAVFRPSNGTWYILKPNGNFDGIPFGLSTDKLVPADYDGDGKIDVAVKRSNTTSGRSEWYVLQSRDGYIVADFGFATDKATVNSLIRQ